MVSTYVSYLSVARNLNASLSSVASQATVSRDSAYYKENIDKVTTVDEFMGDYKLYSYAMKAYGLDDMTYAKAFMKKVLESDLSDSSSFANSLSDGRYAEFAAAFKFGGETKTAQSDVQRDNLLDAYEESFDTEADDIADETDYFEDNISSITSVDEFLSSSRLKNYALTAFGLSTEYTSSSFLKQVLTSDLDDADSFVNQLGDDVYVSLARAFNFNEDGSTDGDLMSEDQISLVSSAYAVASSTIASTETGEAYDTYFAAEIGNITSVDQLMSDDKLVGYLRIAYGLSDDESDSYISAALKAPTSPKRSACLTCTTPSISTRTARLPMATPPRPRTRPPRPRQPSTKIIRCWSPMPARKMPPTTIRHASPASPRSMISSYRTMTMMTTTTTIFRNCGKWRCAPMT